jgi:hypothetical protein
VCGVGVVGVVVVVVVDTSWFYFRQLFFCDGTIKKTCWAGLGQVRLQKMAQRRGGIRACSAANSEIPVIVLCDCAARYDAWKQRQLLVRRAKLIAQLGPSSSAASSASGSASGSGPPTGTLNKNQLALLLIESQQLLDKTPNDVELQGTHAAFLALDVLSSL